MMRENQSDSEDGWPRPGEYISPWASREAGEAPRGGSGQAPHPDPDDEMSGTLAFGGPASEPHGSADQQWYVAPGYGPAGPGSYGPAGPGSYGWRGEPPPERRRGRRGGHWLVYLTVAALAAGVGAGLTAALDGGGPAAPGPISSRDIPTPSDNAAGSGTLNQPAVERKVKPGLVDVTATLKYDSETAEGTGMILSASGLVLTNNHVIDGATSVTATLVDSGRPYQARVVGYDSKDDVALLQLIGAAGLPTVSFGNSAQVKVGAAVLALGNADGRGGVTPAAGIINGLNRSIQASDAGSDTTEDLNHMLETDALIQQGDSGGALANSAGQVIGMVTAANTGSDGGTGGTTGFAIPIDSALIIAREIAAGQAGPTVYIGLPGFLGVEVGQSASPNPVQQAIDQRRSENSPGPPGGSGSSCLTGGQPPGVPSSIAPARTGALIMGILCNTAADSPGLVPGDVITAVDGQAVTTPGSLTSITAEYHPGDVVKVSWESISGARHTISITLGSGPAR